VLIVGGNQSTGGYEVSNSLRFNDGSSDKLTRSNGTPDSERKFTFSLWTKRSNLGNFHIMQGFYNNSSNYCAISFLNNTDELDFINYQGSTTARKITNRKFRDPNAWLHIVVAVDTTQGTADNRIKMYINGVQETSFRVNTAPSQNADLGVDMSTAAIGVGEGGSIGYYDGYMSEVVFIDGQALDPTSFGEFDEDSAIWKPIDVSDLTFGNNGYYLDFENSSSLGADVSGNGNNFSVSNLTSIDQSIDTCTNNFCTLNGLSKDSGIELAEGNLKYVQNAAGANGCVGTFGLTQGKWYFEVKDEQVGNDTQIGVYDGTDGKGYPTAYLGANSSSWGVISINGNRIHNGSQSSYGSGFSSNDIIMVAIDMDNGKWYAGKNGTWFNSGNPATGSNPAHSGINGGTGTIFPAISNNNTGNLSYLHNFGSPPFSISSGNSDADGHGNFEYSVPSGYFALCSKNLAEYG